MRKYMGIVLLLIVLLAFTGCSAKDEGNFFIPDSDTEWGEELHNEDDEPDDIESDPNGEEVDEDEPPFVGNTTKMYVKLSNYDAILNVRSLPSREGEVIGFLVHTEEVNVIEIENGWASFLFQNKLSYCSADFLVTEKPAYLTPPPPAPQSRDNTNPDEPRDI